MTSRGAAAKAAPDVETIIALVLMGWTVYRAVLLLRSAWAFTTDDAYITLRYARHLVEGHGIVWNVGEPPVEGYSNFLFVLIGAAALARGMDPILCFKAVSVAALFGTLVLSYRLARNWCGPIASVIPAFLLIRYAGTIVWTVSGLETAVYQFLVLAAVSLAFTSFAAPGTRARLAVLLVCGFVTAVASLTRPEAPVLILVLSVATILASSSPDDRRSALVGLWTGFGVVFLPYFAWRLWHFGRLLPNPAYCKLAYGGDPWVLPAELWEFGRYYVLFALIQSPRSLDARHFLLAAVPLVYAALLIGVDPILAYWNRLAMPALPPLLVLATVGMTNIGTWVSRSSRARHESVLFVVVVLVSFLTTRGLGGMLQSYADRYARLMSTRRAVGDWVHETLAPNDRFVTGDAGLIPYVANARAIDALCLNSREATERPGRRDPHAFWSWILEQRPAVVLLPSSSSARLEGPSTAVSERPGFRDGYRLVKVFVTPGHRYHYFAYRRGD